MSADRAAALDDILADVLGVPRHAITPDLSGETCEAWDSANHIRIVLTLEERFGVRLSLDDLETSMSRRALLDHVLSANDRDGHAARR